MVLISAEITFGGTIKGHVREKKTKSPLVGADIFIEGTSLGSLSDTSGDYIIEDVPAGKYKVAAYEIGYVSTDEKVDIASDTSVAVLNFSLAEKPITENENIIEARANNTLETAARATEKNSENIVNVISAQAIEQSTDLSAADVMQRVSGMSVVRQQGEARYVVMRGLEQQYNNTLVDGIKIPSPESKDRFVPLDIFSSSLFERIESDKSLTPDLPGDAIGGTTDLILRKAPENFTFSLNAASGSSSGVAGSSFSTFDRSTVDELDPERLHGTVDEEDPTTEIKPRYNPTPADFTTANLMFTNKGVSPDVFFNGLIGDRFFDNRLGIMAAGAVQNSYVYVPDQFYSISQDINTFDQAGHIIPYVADSTNQNYYTNRTRGGAVVNADFIAGEGHELSATYLYVVQQEAQTRHETQVTIDGERGAADFTYSHRSALRTQDISSISLGGKDFTDSPASLTWTLNYTDALQDRPDEAEYSVYQNYNSQHVLSSTLGLANITHDWRWNDDRQYLGKLDGTYRITSDGTQTIQAGGVVQGLRRANYEDDYQLNPYVFTTGPYAGHTEPFTTIDSAVVTVFGYGTTSGTSVYGYQNYKASEVLLAYYLEYKAILGQLQILGGVRWEQTHDVYNTMANPVDSLRQADIYMVNFLPGIHFRYEITPEELFHLSITQSMSRPSYFDLVPAVDRSDESSSTGNPGLRPAVSTNVDLRYEYYPTSSDVYSAGVYYKRIMDPIEDQFSSASIVLNTSKINGPPATVYGFEAVATEHLDNFGVTANYTYVISKITTVKQVTIEDINSGDLTQLYYTETVPLESQSPQIVNVILSYDNLSWGTKLELAYNYTGKRLHAVAQLDGYDTYEEGVGQLDFSGEQTLFFNLKLYVKLTNLTNAQDVLEIESGEYLRHAPIVIERDLNKIAGSAGISYNF